jgi:hypothetical protein
MGSRWKKGEPRRGKAGYIGRGGDFFSWTCKRIMGQGRHCRGLRAEKAASGWSEEVYEQCTRVGKCSSSSQIPRGKLECHWTQGDAGGAQSPASVTGLGQAFVLVVPWLSECAMTRIGPVSSGMTMGSMRVERVSFLHCRIDARTDHSRPTFQLSKRSLKGAGEVIRWPYRAFAKWNPRRPGCLSCMICYSRRCGTNRKRERVKESTNQRHKVTINPCLLLVRDQGPRGQGCSRCCCHRSTMQYVMLGVGDFDNSCRYQRMHGKVACIKCTPGCDT